MAPPGGIEPGAITFDLCRELVDDYILVSEEEIKSALRLIIEKQSLLVEGAAALSLAALLQQVDRFRGRKVVLILSGGRLGIDTLKSILD